MLDLTCLCGAVHVRADARPEFVHDCNCTLCSKSGARWGYYLPAQVAIEGETRGFVRTDKAEAGAEVHSCSICGATTHFVLTAAMIAWHGNTIMGVNSRLADDAELAGVEVRYPDGRAWPGFGEFIYRRAPEILSSDRP